MASSYPGAFDSFPTITADKLLSDAVGGRAHRAMHNDMGDVIEAMQAELGLNPSGQAATVAARLDNQSVFNVRDYGAVGNGTTDDSAAIRAALAASDSGDVVVFPDGTYKVSQDASNAYCLSIPTGRTLTGSGRIKLAASQASSVRVIHVASDDVTLNGITIDGNGAAQTVDEHRHGLACSGARLTLRDVTIVDCTGDAIMFYNGATGCTVTGLRSTGCDRDGISLYTDTGQTVSDITVSDSHITCAVQPIDSEPEGGTVTGIRIVNNYLAAGDGSGNEIAVAIGGTSPSVPTTGWTVTGNTMVGGIHAISVDGATITGNTIDATGYSTADAAVIIMGYARRMIVADNTIKAGAGKVGVYTYDWAGDAPASVSITGNTVTTSGGGKPVRLLGGVRDVSIRGNILNAGNYNASWEDGAGIEVYATAGDTSVAITDNLMVSCQTGIYVWTYSTNTISILAIVGNVVRNDSPTPNRNYGIRLLGTAGQYGDVTVAGNIIQSSYTTPFAANGLPIRQGGTPETPVFACTGTPEGQITAGVGAMALRRDGGASTTLYIKQSGTGNTGWVAK